MRFAVDDRVRKCVHVLPLHATSELAGGDMIATEAKYHRRCLLNLNYKAGRAKSTEYKDGMDENLSQISGEVFALEMKSRRILDATLTVFKLIELNKLYCASLVCYKVPISSKTRLSRILLWSCSKQQKMRIQMPHP